MSWLNIFVCCKELGNACTNLPLPFLALTGKSSMNDFTSCIKTCLCGVKIVPCQHKAYSSVLKIIVICFLIVAGCPLCIFVMSVEWYRTCLYTPFSFRCLVDRNLQIIALSCIMVGLVDNWQNYTQRASCDVPISQETYSKLRLALLLITKQWP